MDLREAAQSCLSLKTDLLAAAENHGATDNINNAIAHLSDAATNLDIAAGVATQPTSAVEAEIEQRQATRAPHLQVAEDPEPEGDTPAPPPGVNFSDKPAGDDAFSGDAELEMGDPERVAAEQARLDARRREVRQGDPADPRAGVPGT